MSDPLALLAGLFFLASVGVGMGGLLSGDMRLGLIGTSGVCLLAIIDKVREWLT